MKHGKLYLRHNTFADEIPIMIVLKAMGLESDQEAVQLVGPDPAYASLLAPSLQECASHGVFTQQQALEYCGAKVRAATEWRTAEANATGWTRRAISSRGWCLRTFR